MKRILLSIVLALVGCSAAHQPADAGPGDAAAPTRTCVDLLPSETRPDSEVRCFDDAPACEAFRVEHAGEVGQCFDGPAPSQNAAAICATALERNADLGCAADGPGVDVCPPVWSGAELCDAAREAVCLERLVRAPDCYALRIVWRGDCLTACSPVSP